MGTLTLPVTGTETGLANNQQANAVAAELATMNQGTTAPTAASTGLSSDGGVWWHDTANSLIKLRDQADTTWISIGSVDEINKRWGVLGATLALTAKASFAASAAGGAGVNLAPGTAPTSPNNGDLWTTSVGLFAQINGATVGPLGAASGATIPAASGELLGGSGTAGVASAVAVGAGLSLTSGTLSATAASGVFVSGSNEFYGTNLGSPYQGAFEAHETVWEPVTQSGGSDALYHSIFLDSVGLSGGTATNKWNTSIAGLYIQAHADSGGSLAGSHLNGIVVQTTIPAGISDGQNGGTFSGGIPGNTYYQELSSITAVSILLSPGMYTEGIASYIGDNANTAGAGGSATGYKSRMTGFLAGVYKNYAGADYGSSAFIAVSGGTQQGTTANPYAPSSILRGIGGWLVGLDFTGVTNIAGTSGVATPAFVALALPNNISIWCDTTDLIFTVNNTQALVLSATAATFDVPVAVGSGGTVYNGVSFTGAPSASFQVVNGIVVHN